MLISCPECNTKVSDKASVCPHCGFRIDTLIRCPDCDKLVRPGTVACPGCGYPFSTARTLSDQRPAQVTCPECGGILSDRAQACPHCGAPPAVLDQDEGQPEDDSVTTPKAQATRGARSEDDADAAGTGNPISPVSSAPPTSKVALTQAAKSQQLAKNDITRGTKRIWFYEVHGFVYGPTSADDVYGRVLDGRLQSNVSVWRQGSGDWTPATDQAFFSKEGPDVADVTAQGSLAESDALPPMVSPDGMTTYKYYLSSDETPQGTYPGVAQPTDSVSRTRPQMLQHPEPNHRPNVWRGLLVGAVLITIAGAIGRSCASSLVEQANDQGTQTQGSQPAWVSYTAPDGAFTASFPAVPKTASETVKVSGLDVKTNKYSCDTDGKPPFYSVTVVTYPWAAATASESEARVLLESMVGGMGSASGWSPVSSTSGTDGEYYTINLTLKGVDDYTGLYMGGRAWTKSTNQYVLATLTSNTNTPQSLEKFLGSVAFP